MSSSESTTPTSESWTVGRLLTWTADYLKKHGSSTPRLDAEVLLAQVRSCERIELYTTFNEEVSEEVRAAFRELIRQRAQGKPVAYLVGHREFYSLSFRVTPDVLIPRPETEDLVVALLDVARTLQADLEIADVGTGSGVLAVCAAKHLPQARLTAVDISPAALEVARHNVDQFGLSDRIELAASDLLSALPAERQFDVIVSNPPYVSSAEFEQLSKDVKDFEPKLALVAGPHGTETIERLLAECRARLRPGGWFLCELSPMISRAVEALIRAQDLWQPPRLIKDSARHQRIVVVQRN